MYTYTHMYMYSNEHTRLVPRLSSRINGTLSMHEENEATCLTPNSVFFTLVCIYMYMHDRTQIFEKVKQHNTTQHKSQGGEKRAASAGT